MAGSETDDREAELLGASAGEISHGGEVRVGRRRLTAGGRSSSGEESLVERHHHSQNPRWPISQIASATTSATKAARDQSPSRDWNRRI